MADQSGARTLGRSIGLDKGGDHPTATSDSLNAIRDLADRLRDCQGAANLVATVVGMAASVADDLREFMVEQHGPERPETVERLYAAVEEHGAHVVRAQTGEAFAYADSADNAATVAEALNVLAAIKTKEAE